MKLIKSKKLMMIFENLKTDSIPVRAKISQTWERTKIKKTHKCAAALTCVCLFTSFFTNESWSYAQPFTVFLGVAFVCLILLEYCNFIYKPLYTPSGVDAFSMKTLKENVPGFCNELDKHKYAIDNDAMTPEVSKLMFKEFRESIGTHMHQCLITERMNAVLGVVISSICTVMVSASVYNTLTCSKEKVCCMSLHHFLEKYYESICVFFTAKSYKPESDFMVLNIIELIVYFFIINFGIGINHSIAATEFAFSKSNPRRMLSGQLGLLY